MSENGSFDSLYTELIVGLCRLHNESPAIVFDIAHMYKNCFTKAEISQIVSNASLTVDFWKDVYTAIQGIDTTPVNPMEEAVHLVLKDFGIDIIWLIIAHLHKPLSLLSNLFRFIPLSKNKSLLKKIDALPPALIGRAKIYIEKLNELHFEELSIEKETPSNPKNA